MSVFVIGALEMCMMMMMMMMMMRRQIVPQPRTGSCKALVTKGVVNTAFYSCSNVLFIFYVYLHWLK